MIERNGGGEGNCLLLVEATHELRPEEGEGDRHGENWGRGVLDGCKAEQMQKP